jgi:hypothetical protein
VRGDQENTHGHSGFLRHCGMGVWCSDGPSSPRRSRGPPTLMARW